MKKRISTVLLALVMALTLLPVTAFADGKTLVVNAAGGGDYTTIQAAIDYIAAQSDKTGWTIEVKNGDYARFTVLAGLTDLTIEGESEAGVVVSVLDDTYTKKTLDDNGGINVFGKNVTLRKMTINAGTVIRNDDKINNTFDAAITTNNLNTGGANFSLTVDQCTVKKDAGIDSGALYGIFWNCPEMSVTNCTISGFANAIEIMCDNFKIPAGKTCSFTSNTITGASFAIHGYMGSQGGNEKEGGGKLLIANNTVTGTDELRSKIVCMDNDKVTDSFIIDIHDNKLTNVLVGLVSLQDEGDVVSDVLARNTFGVNCFYVTAAYPDEINFYTTYQAPSGQKGRWMLKDTTGWEKLNGDDIDISVVQDAIDAANAAGSRELIITGVKEGKLIKTFTHMKDIIYWVTDTEEVLPEDETPSHEHEHTRRQPTTVTETTPQTEDVTSAKTFDAGIAVYAAMAVLSMTGSAWIVGKRH